jgi:acyl-coenzyme A thioesterase PaaI-like protein
MPSTPASPSTPGPAAPAVPPALDVPELTGEEGWLDLRRDMWPDKGPSFVSGDRGDRLRVKYFRNQATGHLVGKVWFGPGTQGPPGHAHGGSMAALLDEVMGTAAWISGHPVLAASIKIDFRNTIPLQTVAFFEGWVDAVDGKKVTTRAKLLGPDGKVFAEGEGLFIRKENFFGKFGETNMKGMKMLEKYAARQQAEKDNAAKAED